MRGAVLMAAIVAFVSAHAEGPDAGSAIEELADRPSKVILTSLVSGKHAEITDGSEQRDLLTALAQGYRESGHIVEACFNPRHQLHIEKGAKSVDFIICFECLQVYARGFGEIGWFTMSRSPEAVFNASLVRHHIAPQ